MRSFAVLAIGLSLTACIEVELPSTPEETTSGSTSGGPASTGSATSADGSTADSADDSTGETGSTSSTSDDTTGTGGLEGSVCDPQPEDFFVQIELVEDGSWPDPDLEIDADCVVSGVVSRDPITTVELACEEGEIEPVRRVLEVVRSDAPLTTAFEGRAVHLQLAKNYPIDGGAYFYVMLRDEGGQILLARYIRTLLGQDVEAAEWFAPLTFELVTGVCDPEPFEESGDFVVPECPAQFTRLAVNFDAPGEQATIYDRNQGQLAGLDVYVTGAVHREPQSDQCGPFDFMSFVAFAGG